jgi:hypothetical protein
VRLKRTDRWLPRIREAFLISAIAIAVINSAREWKRRPITETSGAKREPDAVPTKASSTSFGSSSRKRGLAACAVSLQPTRAKQAPRSLFFFGGNVVRQESDQRGRGRMQLSLLGILFTNEGQKADDLLGRYREYQAHSKTDRRNTGRIRRRAPETPSIHRKSEKAPMSQVFRSVSIAHNCVLIAAPNLLDCSMGMGCRQAQFRAGHGGESGETYRRIGR